ncbi:MAG: GNAT family N-acetyltransferase [Campylobacterales bacterium]|nr:GNAT family N-acetyltransferase [Campylobacterales bacterium]
MLLERLFSEACALGMRRIVLEVRTDNSGAIGLYEKHGFATLRRLGHFYRDGCDALLM